VLENFVASELIKQLSFTDLRATLFHFRTSDGKEVDFVLEQPNGHLAGIEVKAADRVQASDFKGLLELQQQTGDDFRCGVVLYQGTETVAFGEKLWAVPLSSLWH
jgi:predicted AAA+ superfamily ATPase